MVRILNGKLGQLSSSRIAWQLRPRGVLFLAGYRRSRLVLGEAQLQVLYTQLLQIDFAFQSLHFESLLQLLRKLLEAKYAPSFEVSHIVAGLPPWIALRDIY